MSATERQTHTTVEIEEQGLVPRAERGRERTVRSDGEITVAEPNGFAAAVAENAILMRRPGQYGDSRHPIMGRVPRSLTDISSIAVAPEMVSIGPVHCGKEMLVEFESSKQWFLNRQLDRIAGPDRNEKYRELLMTVQNSEHDARRFYDQDDPMPSPGFIEMMVLDGCFIIELFRDLSKSEHISIDPWLIPIITRDLLKLENQFPFFILEALFKVIAADVEDPLMILALKFFNLSWPRPNLDESKIMNSRWCPHLLAVFHSSFSFTLSTMKEDQLSPFRLIPPELPPFLAFQALHPLPEQSEEHRVSRLRYWSVSIPIFCLRWSVSAVFYCIGWSIAILRLLCNILTYCLRWSVSLPARFLSLFRPNSEEHRHSALSIQSTTQLRPSGVKFKPHINAHSFLDIRFTKGVLLIPPITINDLTITVFINCLAYEHLSASESTFTQYIAFLRCLINSPKDVAFLCAEGIITSYSQNDFYIARLFNQLGEKIYVDRNTRGYLDEEFEAVEAYYNSHWATFMRTYFSTPWSFISVVSAVILLLLTGGQTALAVLSYINKRSS